MRRAVVRNVRFFEIVGGGDKYGRARILQKMLGRLPTKNPSIRHGGRVSKWNHGVDERVGQPKGSTPLKLWKNRTHLTTAAAENVQSHTSGMRQAVVFNFALKFTIRRSTVEFPKDYLGEGVYASYDGFSIELRANDFESPTDSIVLEPNILEALNRFSERCASWRAMELKKQQPTAAAQH